MDASAKLAFNIKVLKRHDPSIIEIIESASFVVLYSHQDGAWAKTGIEGPMFLFRKSTRPAYGFFILNRNGVENFSATLTHTDDLELTSQFIIYHPAPKEEDEEEDEEEEEEEEEEDIYGIWVFEEKQRVVVGEQMLKLQQQSDSPSAQAVPLASAAGVEPSAPAPAPSAQAGQSIDLNTLFASAATPSQAAPQQQQPSPQATGMSLLDSMFKNAAVSSSSAPKQEAPAVATPPPPPQASGTSLLDAMFSKAAVAPTPAKQPKQAPPAASLPEPTSSAPTTQGLLALLGLSSSSPAAPKAAGPAPAAPQSLSLDALFASAKPAAPAKPAYKPKPNVNASFDVSRAPSFDQLPTVAGQPQGCAWGLFDRAGVKDELGTLNYLTPANTARAAASEIRTGERVQLDWPMDKPYPAAIPGRQAFEHKILDRDPKHVRGYVNDDAVSFNTQSGSQIDGFRHVGHRKTGTYYNGLHHDEFKVSPNDAREAGHASCTRNGIHAWCDAGGIAGRGVLLDWLSWWQSTHPGQTAPEALTPHAIPLSELLACAKAQGTELKPADILFVRSGFTAWYESASQKERSKALDTQGGKKVSCIGVDHSEEVKRWLWNSHFALVAGDAVAWEVMDAKGWSETWLHEWLLGMWGCPIGEMLDLESLSEICKRNGRWSFFLTGAPMRVTGGVATPPQMIAIF